MSTSLLQALSGGTFRKTHPRAPRPGDALPLRPPVALDSISGRTAPAEPPHQRAMEALACCMEYGSGGG